MTNPDTTALSLATLTNVALEKKLDMKDVMNVIVSRFEDALYQRNEDLTIKSVELTEQRKAVVKRLTTECKTEMSHNVDLTAPGSKHKFVLFIDVKQLSVTLAKNEAGVYEMTVRIPVRSHAAETFRHYYGGSTFEFPPIPLSKEDNDLMISLDQQLAETEEMLNKLKMEKVNMGRKVRKIQAVVSEQALKQHGIDDLLALPEIANVLQLTV